MDRFVKCRCLYCHRSHHPADPDAAGIDGADEGISAVVFAGITATFFYNFFANLLRSVGESVTP
jgi:hypothetical protein